MKTKICKKCKFPQTIDSFYKKKGGKFGIDSVCKHCSSLSKKQRFKAKKAKEQKKKNRKLIYGLKLRAELSFLNSNSEEAHKTLDILLQSINANLIHSEEKKNYQK
jgi:superfamily II helicase